MAPEQATFNALDIDTRADVYALGVLLYELLAGSPPVEAERLKKAALDEVLRLVREEEPPRPSQRLSTSQTKASIAAVRGSDPAKLSVLMRGELDWIVMKALEKDRGRRYDTATALAKDVQRYINGDAVEACPPTLGYRLRKAYRRNRATVLVGGAFVLLLLTGVAVTSVLAIQARRAEALAREKEQEAQEQRREAEQSMDALSKTTDIYWDAAVDAEIRSAGSRLDADLLEYKSDPRAGLLRLARPLTSSITIPVFIPSGTGTNFMTFEKNPEFVKLREFQAAAIITAGQDFVPLVPPFEGNEVRTSPDGQLCIGGDERRGLELLTLPGLARKGVFREGTERVLQYGFSPDGQTAWTQDSDSVVRFWNLDCTLRTKTALRPERFVYPAGMDHSEIKEVARYTNPVLVADGVAVIRSEERPGIKPQFRKEPLIYGNAGQVGPMDLYSTRTGQFLRRLDRKGWTTSECKLAANGRWLVYQEELLGGADQVVDRALVIVSADDGRQLARLTHPVPESSLSYAISPSGKWVFMYRDGGVSNRAVRPEQCVLWHAADWKQVQDVALKEVVTRIKEVVHPRFVTDDVLLLCNYDGFDNVAAMVCLGNPAEFAKSANFAGESFFTPLVGELGGTLIRCGRVLTDANTLQRLKPQPGLKYAAEFAKLAPDGRFWGSLDTVTERVLPSTALFEERNYVEEGLGVLFSPSPCVGRYFPRYGHVGVTRENESLELRILPDASKLTVPPEMVELWAKVVVGGELTPEGVFQPWDEPTWTVKQKQLAAMTPPYADFPFPGWAATEPHLWYRIQASMTQHGSNHEKLWEEWRRRSGRVRPKPEPDTWRTPGPAKPEPMKEPAPPPRAVK